MSTYNLMIDGFPYEGIEAPNAFQAVASTVAALLRDNGSAYDKANPADFEIDEVSEVLHGA